MTAGLLRRDDAEGQPLCGRGQSSLHLALTGLAVAVAYYFCMRVGLALRLPPDNLAAFWPPATILLVGLLMMPPHRWWVMLLAALPSHVIAVEHAGGWGLFSLFFALLSWFGTWLATVALRCIGGEPWRLAGLQDFYSYTLWAVIAGPVVVASGGTALQTLIRGSEGLWPSWRVRFLATVLVHLTLSPALLIWITGGLGWLKSVSPRRYAAGEDRSTPYEKVYRLRDGRQIPVWLSGALLAGYTDRGVAYAIDLSERKAAETALRKAQTDLTHAARVMIIGELAASLAHELTQPLTAILSNAQAGLRFLAATSMDLGEVRAILGDIVADDQRAGEVIDRLRRLLRRDALERRPLDVNEVIRDVVRLMSSEVVIKNVGVRLDLAAELPTVPGDRVQLQQVILNLLLNSVEAMSAVEERPRQLLIRSSKDGAAGVLVAVRDVGSGLDREQVERIFESFYTTKPNGLGLGLSISRSIIEAHGGRLWATPNEGYGTTFQFTLPAIGVPS